MYGIYDDKLLLSFWILLNSILIFNYKLTQIFSQYFWWIFLFLDEFQFKLDTQIGSYTQCYNILTH